MKKSRIILLTLFFVLIGGAPASAQFAATNSADTQEAIKNARKAITKPLTKDLKAADRASKSANKKMKAWLSNAAVTTIGGSSMTVTKDGKTYAITTNTETKLRRHYGGMATLAEFAVGNFIDISGQWTDNTQTAILASTIRNRSIMIRRGTFIGEIVSKTGNTIVIATKGRGNQTVTVATTTKYTNKSQSPITLADIVIGHRIRVRGTWDKSNNTVTQVSQVKDFSLPAAVSLTPTVTTPSTTPIEANASESAIAQ